PSWCASDFRLTKPLPSLVAHATAPAQHASERRSSGTERRDTTTSFCACVTHTDTESDGRRVRERSVALEELQVRLARVTHEKSSGIITCAVPCATTTNVGETRSAAAVMSAPGTTKRVTNHAAEDGSGPSA